MRISDTEGLAHSDVRAITQDRNGFIWFGLRLAGLTRYDGYELKVYQHDPADARSIGSRVIWSLLVDHRGTLWIGTEGGLDRYDRATDSFVHYRHDPARGNSLPNNVVVCLHEDKTGHLWAGTREGLCRLDDPAQGYFTTYTRPQVIEGSVTKDTFRSIIEDPTTGLLWLGANDGLAAFDPRTGAFATFINDPADPTSLSRTAVNKVIRDDSGTFWALSEYGLNSFKPTFDRVAQSTVQQPRLAFRRYMQPTTDATPGINFVRDGVIDRLGRMWLATRGGLELFDRSTGKFVTYKRKAADPTSIGDDLTQAVFEDRAGNIWIGTYTGGANLLRTGAKPFHIDYHDPGDAHSLSEDRVTGLAIDQKQRLWAATVNGLNLREADGGWTRFFHDPSDPNSPPSSDFASIAIAPSGDIWIGSNYDGVYRYDQHRFQSFPIAPTNVAADGWQSFTGTQIHAALPDDHGGVWLGARAYGLDYYKDGRFLHYAPHEATATSPAQPTTNGVFGFIDAEQLWYATEADGLVRLDLKTQKFTAYQPPIEQPDAARNLHCIARTSDGTIWLGAADGLLKFDPRTQRFVRQFSVADGLPHAAVMSMVRDSRDHLWLGTANGLADFDPATEKFRVYEKADGLPSNVFSQRCAILGPDDRIYLGTRAGIVSFLPRELHDDPTPPPVVITEFRTLGGTAPQVDSTVETGDEVRVHAGQLGFALKFSALDFTAPEKNRFRHRLEGWDLDWIETGAQERSATYTALPPGKYTFQVQASNPDRVWNTHGPALTIVVEPHVWQTYWFRRGFAALLASVLLAAIQWRVRAIRQRNLQLAREVSQRTGELQREIGVREAAEAALRESHSELESRVLARTAELAQSNASLQSEIAERKNIETQLRQSQKMEAIGQLAGGVAHDFNNLLTVILGQSELLTGTTLPVEVRDAAVGDIRAAAQRATNLTRQLLVFSRQQAMTPVHVDLNAVVANVSKLLRHVIGEQIALETRVASAPLGVVADAGMLEQVLLNMAVNARDAMPRGGRLTISTARVVVTPEQARNVPGAKVGPHARFSVSDTGGGIPDAVLAQIFEPFFSTKDPGKGTGLGLAISQGIVQQHQGWIEVGTRIGAGTTFHVYLPLNETEAVAAMPTMAVKKHAPGDATILVAEDEAAVRSVVQRMLTRHGYRVIEAMSGGEALALWAEHKDEVGILLTDIVMPGAIDGHELAARLLADKPNLRVVTMSGYDPADVAGRGGITHPHVRKPFTADELLQAIEQTARV